VPLMADDAHRDVADMTVSELRARATELEITGRSSMNKDELRQAVTDAEAQLDEGELGDDEWMPGEDDAPGTADDGEKPASEITAPSIGPNTVIEKEPPEERLAKHEQSDVDAMGLDKRRGVVGQKYGASAAKQATVYGVAVAVIVALVIGGKLAIDELDKGPKVNEDRAPWTGADREPAPLDFPRGVTP
jgi:Rho termination factor, N-terminal domain